MKFKLDENLPRSLASILGKAGHDALSVVDQGLSGEPDRRIAAVCNDEGRALVTLDTGFSNIRAYPPGEYSGIIVLRLKSQDSPGLRRAIERVIPLLDDRSLERSLWIVEDGRVRFRD